MDAFITAKEKWLSEGLVLLPPENRDSVISCFNKLGVKPPEDIIILYSVLGGMEDMDEEYFRLWPLNEIAKDNSGPENLWSVKIYGALFADYLINSWCYRVVPLSDQESSVSIDYFYSDQKPEVRGKTLLNFFELMLEDPDEVLL